MQQREVDLYGVTSRVVRRVRLKHATVAVGVRMVVRVACFSQTPSVPSGSLGAFGMMEFTLKPQSVREALKEMKEDAAWFVTTGELTFEIGDRKFVAPEGAFVLLPRGTGHRVWASGKTPTKYLLIRSPG